MPYKMLSLVLILVTLGSIDAKSYKWFGHKRALKDDGEAVGVCGPSELGFQCYRKVCGAIQLHWSLGGPPPGSGCKYSAAAAANNTHGGALDAKAQVAHFALSTDYGGYVSMSLAAKEERMSPADAVIGWMGPNGVADVKAYYINGYHSANIQPDAQVTLSNTGAVLDAKGRLTICFSRIIDDVGGAGMKLRPGMASPTGTAMNFAAAKVTGLHKHSMDDAHLCSDHVALVAKLLGEGGDGEPKHHHDYTPSIDVHGLLMLASWLVLVPIGIMSARHRWLTASSGGAAWFQVHRTVQVLACVLFFVAFSLPFISFGDHGDEEENETVEAHGAIGISVAIVTGTHLLGTLIRPKPDSPRRWLFNMVHAWMGRLAWLAATINILIGVQVYHLAFECSRTKWYAPIGVLLVAFVCTAAFLEYKARLVSSYVYGQLPMGPAPNEPTAGGMVAAAGITNVAQKLVHRVGGSGGSHGGLSGESYGRLPDEPGGNTEMVNMMPGDKTLSA